MYMGIASLKGMQFIDRVFIMFMPQKYQPDYIYLRHVQLKKVHIFTAIQVCKRIHSCESTFFMRKYIILLSFFYNHAVLLLIADLVPCIIVGYQIDQGELVDISTYGKIYWFSIQRNSNYTMIYNLRGMQFTVSWTYITNFRY